MMQGAMDGDNSASARKALAKVQKMLQLVSTKRQALALHDYRETLDECLKTEASSTMKILGYRMASRVPTCTTHELWQLLLDASITELASSQNAPVLLYSIPILEQIPLPLVIGFLISSEKEPMNKLRAVLQHEQSDVRCCAIASISRVTLEIAASIAQDGLYAFPFESHESRTVCQQDLWTIITDVWKIIFQALLHTDGPQVHADVVGAAFTAMRLLFTKTSLMAPFTSPLSAQLATNVPTATQSAANDLAAFVYKEAFPRIRSLVHSAERLPVKCQVDAAWWLSMLLYFMMERTGAKCPGVSVAYLEIDVVKSGPHEDDDDEGHSTTERARIDQLAASVLDSWLVPLLGRHLPLVQSSSVCRGIFILLSHQLLSFARKKTAAVLVQQLVAQCFYHKVADTKLELSHLTVRAFAWLSSNDSVAMFARVVEAIHLTERESDRHDLLQLLMDGVSHRVITSRDFLLLESITALDVFHQPLGASKLSPRTCGSHVYRALVQSLLPQQVQIQTQQALQVAQIIVLKAFIQVLLYKTNGSIFTRPLHDHETHDVLCYVALLSEHFQNALRRPELLLKESLQFYQHDLQRAWKQITSCSVRLQLLWIGIQLANSHQVVPVSRFVELMNYEVSQSFSSEDDEGELSAEAMAVASSSVFDDGKLGGGSPHGVIVGDDTRIAHRDEHEIGTTLTVVECMKALSTLDPQTCSTLQQLQTKIRTYYTGHLSVSSLHIHILEETLSPGPSASTSSVYAFEGFRPMSIFTPPRHTLSPTNHGAVVDTSITTPVLISGAADPFAIHVVFRQPLPGHEDVITLCVSCCNTSGVALSDFEIHIRPQGPVRCVDPSNDLKIRIQQGGSSTSSTLAPFATLKAEKRFLIQRFAQASFYFQVVFLEADSSGGDDQPIPMPVAVASPYIFRFDGLFRRPPDSFSTGAFFQQLWRSAEDSIVLDIEGVAESMQGSLSAAQSVLKYLSPRIVPVAELLLDLPTHTQISLLTKTRWDDYVLVSITMSLTSAIGATPRWTGICEIRSTKTAVFEFSKHQKDALTVFCGVLARLKPDASRVTDASSRTASSTLHSASRTASRVASRHTSSRLTPSPLQPVASPVVDPFGGSAFPTTDFSTSFNPMPPPPATSSMKWPQIDGQFGSNDAFGMDQLRPSTATSSPAPVDFGGFEAFSTSTTSTSTAASNSDPWGF